MDTFVYQPLDLKTSAFRLVRLLKGLEHEDIECELIHTTLDENVIPYEAVSYTWGTSFRPLEIKLQEKRFAVTLNLWHLLKSIRHIQEDRYLWIDAIAINQDNDLERGHQVQRMKTIYGSAERVIVYLGEQTGHWASDDERWQVAWGKVRSEIQFRYGHTVKDFQREGLQELLERPWFRRVWILQEVANARRVLIYCGTAAVRAQIFAMAPIILETDLSDHVAAVFELMPTFFGGALRKPRDGDILSILLDFRRSQASDPRDKIFALLGLCEDQRIVKRIVPDYTKDEENIVHNTIKYVLARYFDQFSIYLPLVDELGIDEFLNGLALPYPQPPRCIERILIHVLESRKFQAAQSFLSRKTYRIEITRELVNAASSNRYNALEAMGFLLRHGGFDGSFNRGLQVMEYSLSSAYTYFIEQLDIITAISIQSHREIVVSVKQEDICRFVLIAPEYCLGWLILRFKGEDATTVELLNKLQQTVRQGCRDEPLWNLRNDPPMPLPPELRNVYEFLDSKQTFPLAHRQEIIQALQGSHALKIEAAEAWINEARKFQFLS
ncbi:heterokaryon incompatibility protein-domain-containing protein [Xylaria digitata]|nr:heterokaryon incompatibility protein-domain-containing protein [Xylaria digitata]